MLDMKRSLKVRVIIPKKSPQMTRTVVKEVITAAAVITTVEGQNHHQIDVVYKLVLNVRSDFYRGFFYSISALFWRILN